MGKRNMKEGVGRGGGGEEVKDMTGGEVDLESG
jgi:hypothetical protein